ncbi:MAG: prolyl oligopeptidase family serine peptidase, partial [Gammaproteobacteria bacterium]
DKLLATVSKQYPIDKTRIYATGTSNGGNFTYRLAQERTQVFAAVAPVVAAMPETNKCRPPDGPIPILIMNGTADPILPFKGGYVGRRKRDQEARGSVLSARETVQFWVKHDGADPTPTIEDLPDRDPDDGSRVRVETYANGKDGSEVVFYEVQGGGHTEPSLSQHYGWLYRRIVGPQNHDIEMADAVWAFFQRHHR